MSSSQRREILARLWTEESQHETGEIWRTVCFGEKLRVAAYSEEQEKYVRTLREILQNGALARLKNKSDGTFEIYGASRPFYVTITIEREFVGLLSSWSVENPPREIDLEQEN